GWATEFFCDLYAICTVGEAFAWSNINLYAKYGHNPFHIPTVSITTHPADDARMKVMLYGLQHLGLTGNIDALQGKWNEIIAISGAKPEPEYRRCFPDPLLRQIAEIGVSGVQGIGCQMAYSGTTTPIYGLLNEAWTKFWTDPTRYIAWERNAV